MNTSPSVGLTPQFVSRADQPQVQEFNALPLTVIADERIIAEQARARALGFSAGYAAGARAAAAELADEVAALQAQDVVRETARQTEVAAMFTALSDAISAAQAIQVPLLFSARDMVCSLAFDLARAIVGVELSQDSAAVPGVTTSTLAAVSRAVHASPQTPMLTIKMAPDEAALAIKHWDQVLAYLNSHSTLPADSVTVVADSALTAGSAQAHYPNGYVDATLVSAFDRAQEALNNMLDRPNGVENS